MGGPTGGEEHNVSGLEGNVPGMVVVAAVAWKKMLISEMRITLRKIKKMICRMLFMYT